uniref:Lectin5 n=1 Tax=Antheraea pernyi TaxID=7119 RepID=H9AA73_ANTPE|nr:lectin5 [Antheraea pernyi]
MGSFKRGVKKHFRMFAIFILLVSIANVICKAPDGYVINNAVGHGYKLMYIAQPWDRACEKCLEDGAKLAVPKSEEEFKFIQKIVRGMHYPSIIGSDYNLVAWLGINNLVNYTTWRNVDGENINDTGYHRWAGLNGQGYSDDPAEPHCAGIDGINNGLRDFWCQKRLPYICETQT